MADVDIGRVGNKLYLFVEGEQVVIDPSGPDLAQALLEPTTEPATSPDPAPSSDEEAPRSRTSRRGAHKANRRMKWKW